MTLLGRDVLLVGPNMRSALALTHRLQHWGFQCHFARNMGAAFDLLGSHPFHLVLSNTQLSDGTGFRLLAALNGLPVTVFLCLPVENSCFWLPAMDDGKDCLGSPALGVRECTRGNGPVFKSRGKARIYSTERAQSMTDHSSLESSIQISTDVNLVSAPELFEHTQDIFNLIAQRAYGLFESRGRVHGNDREDWSLAESELLMPMKFHLSRSGEQLTARADLSGFKRQEIKVSLEPHRLSISGKTEPGESHKPEHHPHSHRHAQLMFHVIDLPCAVDPSKARASLRDGRLEVVMPIAATANVRAETEPADSKPTATGTSGAIVKPQATAARK